jgi:hypothetical protein
VIAGNSDEHAGAAVASFGESPGKRHDHAIVDLEFGGDGIRRVTAEDQHIAARKVEFSAWIQRIIDIVRREQHAGDRFGDIGIVSGIGDEIDPDVAFETFCQGVGVGFSS